MMRLTLVLLAAIAAGILALAGGPVAWALIVMIGVPVVLLLLLPSMGHESAEHPHFAPPRPRR